MSLNIGWAEMQKCIDSQVPERVVTQLPTGSKEDERQKENE